MSKNESSATAKSQREIRKSVGFGLEKAAVLAGVSSHTLRIFEANPAAVSEASRAKLDKLYSALAAHDPTQGPFPAPMPPTSAAHA